MVQGCVPGYRARGRQRRRWTDDITEWTGMKINEARLQQRKIVIVGDGYYAPPTLLMEDGTRRRRHGSVMIVLLSLK